jgi:hypothetical protein
MLGSISRMQHAFRVGEAGYLIIPGFTVNNAVRPVPVAANDAPWIRLGFDGAPYSSFFQFAVVDVAATVPGAGPAPGAVVVAPTFSAVAQATIRLGAANEGAVMGMLRLNEQDVRTANIPRMQNLVGANWVN